VSRTLFAVATVMAVATPVSAQNVDYTSAERLLSWNTSRLIAGDEVSPNWMADDNSFWYRDKTGSGHEFVYVNPVGNQQRPLFDHYRLAAAMSLANDTAYVPDKLPFERFDFLRNETAIVFTTSKKRFDCDLQSYACIVGDTLPDDRAYVVSPDSAWEAFVHEYNLYIRPHGGGDTIQLTTDGEEFYGYGLEAISPSAVRRNQVRRPNVYWAPDSRKLAVMRTDERNVEHMHYISYTPQRPKHYSRPYALPGDSIIPHPRFHIIDITPTMTAVDGGMDSDGLAEARNVPVQVEPTAYRLSLASSSFDSTWATGSDKLYATWYTRGSKKLLLGEIDAVRGALRVLAADSAKTNVIGQEYTSAKSWYVTRDGTDVIWWSERDGWAHLWRYDGDGNVRNQITSGPWTASTIHYVDESQRTIYFVGRGREHGRNIYYTHLYRVNFDGSGLTLLTPEDANHEIAFAPSGRFFVDTYSRIETPPVTVLRSAQDGRVIRTLEEADVSRLAEAGWHPAEPFRVKARDGITDLYGVIYFPPDLDTTASYPIIDHIYPGPFIGSVGQWNFKDGGEEFSLAQLGFVVIELDHMGSPWRSKAFHDNYYGDMGDNGIPDHVAAIKQLATRYPFIDLDRIGIYGHSGGGFASTDALLRFPDFYKVAVSGAGNHDQRTYGHYWGETYQGLMARDTLDGTDNYLSQANKLLVENLEGKLLLMHGDMDDNVHPAMTIQVVDELIKANKDFDLIVAPDRAHGLNEPYFIRRRWDYFVKHLMGKEPPLEYEIVRPEN
jgi:dipeptidyl aminopeptidase/acylaminoacyl peptidase